MLPEENEIRRALAERSFRSVNEVWPTIRQRLTTGAARSRPAAGWAALAFFLLVIAVVLSRNPRSANYPSPSVKFKVANVRSLGRPAAAMVLEPDSETVIVIVD
jgi:hypothetical protein